MKKWFLGLIALLLALSIAVILYPHYQQWQQARRAEALKDAPTGKLPEWVLPKAYSLWMQMPETRLQTFNWLKDKYDLFAMFLPEQYLAYAPRLGAYFCDEKRATEVEAFFRSRITPGSAGERQLAQTLEQIKSCTTIKNTVRPIIVPQTLE